MLLIYCVQYRVKEIEGGRGTWDVNLVSRVDENTIITPYCI